METMRNVGPLLLIDVSIYESRLPDYSAYDKLIFPAQVRIAGFSRVSGARNAGISANSVVYLMSCARTASDRRDAQLLRVTDHG